MKVQNKSFAGRELIVSDDISKKGTIKFDDNGIVELTNEQAEILSSVSGYLKVIEETKAEAPKQAPKQAEPKKDEAKAEAPKQDKAGK